MKAKVISLMNVFVLLCLSGSCRSDNYNDYYADQCDASNSSYSTFIAPIIQNRCVSCHNANCASSTFAAQRDGFILVV